MWEATARLKNDIKPDSVEIVSNSIFVSDLQRRVLIWLVQHRVTDDKEVELRAHEAAEGVLRRADDRLATKSPVKNF